MWFIWIFQKRIIGIDVNYGPYTGGKLDEEDIDDAYIVNFKKIIQKVDSLKQG